MPDIHDFRFVTNQIKRQIGETIMEERKYTFYDRYQKVKYDNVSQQRNWKFSILLIIRNIICFSSADIGEIIPYYSVGYSRKSVVQQIFIADRDQNIVADITNEIFFQGAVQ